VFSRISVLVPTRKRLHYLTRMLESYDATVTDPASAEIVFRCDSDDVETIECLRRRPSKLIIAPRHEGYRSLPGFFNDMAAVATGDLLMCCNDDVVFQTPGWPGLLLAEARKYPDGIFNFGVNVGLNDDFFPFSIVSRQLVRTLGFINDERLLFSDVFLLDLAKHFNRAIRVKSVTIFHDWAGHGADETRRDANRHEFEVVFKDATGEWTDEYRRKHEQVVAEAVGKIERSGLASTQLALQRFEAYVPPDGRHNGMWPPMAAFSGWRRNEDSPHGIHYARSEAAQVIDAIYRHGINRGQAVVTSFGNGMSNLLWSQVFQELVSVRGRSASQPAIEVNGHCILSGDLGDTRFLYSIVDRLRQFQALIIDDRRYASAMASYYLIGQHLKRPGIVVFTPTSLSWDDESGARRFVDDLRSGSVDNRRHIITDVVPEGGGPGMSYELLE
jgi:hypothetical protein